MTGIAVLMLFLYLFIGYSLQNFFSGILDDTFALCEACEMPFSSLLSLMEVYRKELDYIVLSRLIDV